MNMRFGAACAALFPFLAFVVVACSTESTSTPSPDGGTTSRGDSSTDDDDDDAVGTGDDDDDAGPDAGKPRPAPVFLEEADYADLITIDPKLPFGVTQIHPADSAVLGSHWGRHDGPMVTLGTYGSGDEPTVVQWKIPADAKGDATSTAIPFTKAGNLPKQLFYGADGMVDLPFGSLSFLSYTQSDSPFPGEVLLYDAKYESVKSRAFTNGIYSGAGLADGNDGLLVYSGLSVLDSKVTGAEDSGLYVAGVCNASFLAPAPCAGPRKLFGWNGASGPVVTDAHGNVFVAASLPNGKTSDVVYGLGRTEITSGGATPARTIAAVDSTGTFTLAAVAPENGGSGWVLGLGYAETAAIYAAPYTEKSGQVAMGDATILDAIKRAEGVDGLSVFSDAEGDLWIAVIKGQEGTFLELRRK